MVGILLATHGKLASGLADSVRMIMGKQERFRTLSLLEGQDIDDYGQKLKNEIIALDDGSGVLVFVDLYAASPYNQAAINKSKIEKVNYKIVSGVNLPMVLEVLGMRLSGMNLDSLTDTALKAGTEGIKNFEIELENFEKTK